MFIAANSNLEVHTLSGALAMSGTIAATALAQAALVVSPYGRESRGVTFTASAAHGLVAASGDALVVGDLNSTNYKANRNRYLAATPAAATATILTHEAWAAATPAGTSTFCAGYTCQDPFLFLGFKLHLSAADTNGETLTLTSDADKGASWDTLVYSKIMTGVTDIIYFPDIPIPFQRKDILKFAWTNTGAKTWALEIWAQPNR